MKHLFFLFALMGSSWALALPEPGTDTPSKLPQELTMVTFNIAGGAPSKYGFKQPLDLPRVGRYLKSLNADFVALQEVDQFVGRNGNPKRDTAGELAKAAGFPHALFGKTIPLKGGAYGIALLSKTAPERWQVVNLPGTGEPRVFIDARFRLSDGRTLAVCATHLTCDEPEQDKQAQAICEHFKKNPADAILLAGDLNAEAESAPLKTLQTLFTLATPEPDKLTWLGGGKAIDHFLIAPRKGAWRILPETRRLPYAKDVKPLSDHMPVLLHVSFEKPSPAAHLSTP